MYSFAVFSSFYHFNYVTIQPFCSTTLVCITQFSRRDRLREKASLLRINKKNITIEKLEVGTFDIFNQFYK